MTDIVDRLRIWAGSAALERDLVEAADEIERLRKTIDDMETEQHESNNLQWREIERLRERVHYAEGTADTNIARANEARSDALELAVKVAERWQVKWVADDIRALKVNDQEDQRPDHG
jgi:regulator of replication initiation timing